MKFFLFLFTILMLTPAYADQAVVYKNEACGHCDMYLYELKYFFEGRNITVDEKLMINNPGVREEISRINSDFGIPIGMQGHMITVIGNLVLEGHVPVEIMEQYFDDPGARLVIYQDEMLSFDQLESSGGKYKVMKDGKVYECEITKNISDCTKQQASEGLPITFLVVSTGLIDGINPCAFGVMLFFIALLYTLRRTRRDLLKVGVVYISMIFIVYFMIGVGILQAIELSSAPHLIARIAAYLIIILGLINIKDYFYYGRWFSLRIPGSQSKRISEWMNKGTLPSVVILGILVGLCTFPCSGGIYVGILSMLSVTTTYYQGLGYLLIYNIMFVLPLIAILVLATSKKLTKKMQAKQRRNKRYMKLINGLIMVGLGLFMLFSGII